MNLAYLVKRGEPGLPSVLTAKTWGFYDVLFKGRPFEFQRPYGSYVMENVLFKISYPAEFHAQTAVEAAHIVHEGLKARGKSSDDIKSVRIRTQEAAIRIIDKQGPLANFADRECVFSFFFRNEHSGPGRTSHVFCLSCIVTPLATWSRTRSYTDTSTRRASSLFLLSSFLPFRSQVVAPLQHGQVCR